MLALRGQRAQRVCKRSHMAPLHAPLRNLRAREPAAAIVLRRTRLKLSQQAVVTVTQAAPGGLKANKQDGEKANRQEIEGHVGAGCEEDVKSEQGEAVSSAHVQQLVQERKGNNTVQCSGSSSVVLVHRFETRKALWCTLTACAVCAAAQQLSHDALLCPRRCSRSTAVHVQDLCSILQHVDRRRNTWNQGSRHDARQHALQHLGVGLRGEQRYRGVVQGVRVSKLAPAPHQGGMRD
jgi:hypothetical protein